MTEVSILTSSHSTFDTRIFHKEARSLSDAGYDVTLITPHDSDTERDGIKIKAVGRSDIRSAGLKHARQIYAEAKKTDADVFHFHDPGLIPFGVLLSERTDGKVVYDCHEDYGSAFLRYDFPPDYLNPFVKRFYPALESLSSRRMDAVVAATEWIAEDFRERGHQNVALLRNFPRKNMLSGGNADVEAQREHTLVYVGGLTEKRGLFRMLGLVHQLRGKGIDVELWLIGDLSSGTLDKTERFIGKNSLEEYVRMFGYVEPENLSAHLEVADIGLCLLDEVSYEYCIPTKIFDYMYCELPVVATETTGTRRYLPENCGRLVSEKDKPSDVVEDLLNDEGLRKRMGVNGRKKVESEYCWEREKEKLLELYRNLTE